MLAGLGAAFFAAWPRWLWNWVPGHGLVVGYLTQVDRAEALGRIDGLRVAAATGWRQDFAVELDRSQGELWLDVPKLRLTRKRKLDKNAVLVDVGVALRWHLWVYPDASDEELSDVAVAAGASWPWRHLDEATYRRLNATVGTAPGAVARVDGPRL